MQLLTLLKINCKLGSKVLLPLEYLVLQVSKGLELLNEYFIEKKYSSGIPYPEIVYTIRISTFFQYRLVFAIFKSLLVRFRS